MIRPLFIAVALALSAVGVVRIWKGSNVQTTSLDTSRFGPVIISSPKTARGVVLLLKEADTSLGQELLERGFAVAELDGARYLSTLKGEQGCRVIGGELERLGQLVRKHGKLDYSLPLIIGGTGRAAPLAFHAPGQASAVFDLRFAVDSCNENEVSLCPGTSETIKTFVHTREGCSSSLIGESVRKEELPEKVQAVVGEARTSSHDLPVIEIASSRSDSSSQLVVFLSGDGGWAAIDKEISRRLTDDGFDIIGFDTLHYFWNERSPEEASGALEALLDRYQERESFVLMGFSLGADVLPFMYSRLPQRMKERVESIILLSPSPMTDFEVTLTDWLPGLAPVGAHSVLDEMKKVDGPSIACLYGDEEDTESLCPLLSTARTQTVSLPGTHHFNQDYDRVAEVLLRHLRSST